MSLEATIDAPATLSAGADAAGNQSVFNKKNLLLAAAVAAATLGLAFLVWQAMKMYARRRADEKARVQSIAAKTAHAEAKAELEHAGAAAPSQH